jgi:hypothetical protein
MKQPKKKTIGQIQVENLQKQPDNIKVQDQSDAMLSDYMKNLFEAVDRGYFKYQDSFYIHVETKKEKLLETTLRNYFIDRKTCPTPNYDQSVYRYNKHAGQIEYLWTIPDRDTCFHLRDNALQIHPSERQLLNFVLQFDDGTLLKMCKKFNGEKSDSVLLEN